MRDFVSIAWESVRHRRVWHWWSPFQWKRMFVFARRMDSVEVLTPTEDAQ